MAECESQSRILSEAHERALDLHGAGLIDKRRIREFDALSHLHVDEMTAKAIELLAIRSPAAPP